MPSLLWNFEKVFYRLNQWRQMIFIMGFAICVALGVQLIFWLKKPQYQVLATTLTAPQIKTILDILRQSHIPFKIDQSTILVPENKLQEAHIKIVKVDTPAPEGFELMERNVHLGTSRLLEAVRYKRALEGELAKTITSLHNIRSARVHLAIPKDTMFIHDKQKATASVLLELSDDHPLGKSQVLAIQQFVAASIGNLARTDVIVLDQSGKLLSTDHLSKQSQFEQEKLEYIQALEKHYEAHILQLLTPLVGANKVKVSVTAFVDFAKLKTEAAIGAKSGSASTLSTAKPASSILTISNLPEPLHLDAPVMQRLSINVILDHLTQRNAYGKLESMPLAATQLDKITTLVKNAIGYDLNRGDQVSIMNVPFAKEKHVIATGPWWQQASPVGYLKLALIGLAVLLAGYSMFRAIFRHLAMSNTQGLPTPTLPLATTHPAVGMSASLNARLQQIATMEPQIVASIITTWLREPI